MGPTALLPPPEGRRAEDFFALINPTASAGFEPANLGTIGQHDTPKPPKPLIIYLKEQNKFCPVCNISDLDKIRYRRCKKIYIF